jgi:hypothetical protein
MVGAAPALLSRARAAALAAVVALLVLWDAGAGVVPGHYRWPDVLVTALVVVPVTLAVPWLTLPLATSRAALPIAAVLGGVALLAYAIGAGSVFNVAKLLALTFVGYLFMQVFEAVSWVALIALIIPWIDAWSVWRGPTGYVVSEKPSLLERISIDFRLPGDDGLFTLGPPDILFFALFLSTAARFGLRTGWTWVWMTCLLALTILATTAFDLRGLPALPAIAVGFLLPNLDLLWRAWRRSGFELGRGRG